MRFTTRGRYALRASLALAKLSKDGKPISISRLSETEDISPVFLEQIFYKLRKAGVVESIRGPGGGFCFSRALEKINLKEILDAAGEDLNLTLCNKKKKQCSREKECISHQVLMEMTNTIKDYFSCLSLASVIEKYDAKFKK